MTNPYVGLPKRNFWKNEFSETNVLDLDNFWECKFKIDIEDQFATYGSCFAQNISISLKKNKLNWINAEPAPYGMKSISCKNFNYEIYSSRTQNIYTPTMLLQYLKWIENNIITEEYWVKKNKYIDPFRPTVEPGGFESIDELINSRKFNLECFGESIRKCSIFVFTLGLTERWINKNSNIEYSICPGTAAGKFDSNLHIFNNCDYSDCYRSLKEAIQILMKLNSKIKIILTVSPVPLIATFENRHVLISTIESKSILRAAAGKLAKEFWSVEYFPSFELVSAYPFKAMFFKQDLRSLSYYGVQFVMGHFYKGINLESKSQKEALHKQNNYSQELICEEEILDAFRK